MNTKSKILRVIIIIILLYIGIRIIEYLYYFVFDDYIKERTWNKTIERVSK